MSFPRTISRTSISVVLRGQLFDVHSTAPNIEPLKDALKAGLSEDEVFDLLSVKKMVEAKFEGKVTIEGETVYLDGVECHNFLAERIIEHLTEGFDVDNLTAFLSNLYRNPNEKIRDQLFAYLEKGRNPITTDGKFWAFKRVADDYLSFHSGKSGRVLHAVGTIVEMPREECHQDETATCVAGLHFCSRDYLERFYAQKGRIVIVEVDPADVTGIPSDYNRTKDRA